MFKRTIVVMDGSDLKKVYKIIGIVEMLAFNRSKVKMESLDAAHPTTKVIKFKSTRTDYNLIKEIIEIDYPALCSFL